MTVSLPVIVYAEEWEVSREKMYRALVVSNLIAIHQKHYIGSLSAYCGAVSAACGAGAGITYMYGGSYEQVSLTIIPLEMWAVSYATGLSRPVRRRLPPQ